ncbi:MAG TPA: hypothetical protein VFE14_10980 [Micromonosporaceae bacterium]|nr:hypothetical protein [Micromonosporaceae bacterium]
MAGRDAGKLPLIGAAGGRRGIALALATFAASRVVQLAIVVWQLPEGGRGLRGTLLAWDAGWFLRVATEGYPHDYTLDANGAVVGNGLAFFPVFPMLIRGVAALGVSPPTAAIAVAWVAGAVAAVLVYLLGTSLYDRHAGFALLVLFSTQPVSVVLSLAYSEGVFVALVAGMLLAAHRRFWLLAGGLGLCAALARPTGAAAALGLLVAAGMAWPDAGRAERIRSLVAAGVALAGVPAYLLWVGLRVGDLGAWFKIQSAGWGTSFDHGSSVGRFVVDTLRGGEGWVPVSVAWLLITATVAATVAVGRVWPPLTVYGLLALILVLGQAGYYHSKPRLLVPVLLILVPAAVAIGRQRPRTAALALGAFAAFGLWYGAYLVAVWPYTI